jgi:arylsulfatase A-like enzyme
MLRLFFLATLLALISTRSTSAADADRPNVIFILADDLGWGDLGCYGHPIIKTPNLDRLAKEGTQFTNFYVCGSVCSPSRCAFFTSHYPAREKIHGHFATPQMNEARGMSQFLDPKVPNVARLLKDAGYTTAHIGKWHLGSNSGGPQPDAYGFDFVGTGEMDGPEAGGADPYFRARSTEIFVNETIEFVRKNKDKPFYAQMWTLVPHATLNPLPEQMERYAQQRAGGAKKKDFPHASAAQIFYASVTNLDIQVGRLMDALKELGLEEKTLIVFSSDNGPEDIHIINAGHSGIGSAGPFRGRKRSLYEGGVRVPFLVRWPGHVPAGRIENDAIVAGADFLPTICKLANVALPADMILDGEDASDIFLGKSRPRTKPLMWEWRFNIAGEPFHKSPILAIRDGNWKLLLNPDKSRVELYDLPKDPTQLNNVAEHHADMVERLSKQVLDWQSTLPAGPMDPNAGKMTYPWPGKADAGAKRK